MMSNYLLVQVDAEDIFLKVREEDGSIDEEGIDITGLAGMMVLEGIKSTIIGEEEKPESAVPFGKFEIGTIEATIGSLEIPKYTTIDLLVRGGKKVISTLIKDAIDAP